VNQEIRDSYQKSASTSSCISIIKATISRRQQAHRVLRIAAFMMLMQDEVLVDFG
jgi:hypothetical protein